MHQNDTPGGHNDKRNPITIVVGVYHPKSCRNLKFGGQLEQKLIFGFQFVCLGGSGLERMLRI